ncbi:MAG: hypothetical protein KatS3mg065_0643 [Chloroflexota bacterium]|nr:MAG: hypothetical protein KatS3mg065_0643 [Chloroflexota bacterium]
MTAERRACRAARAAVVELLEARAEARAAAGTGPPPSGSLVDRHVEVRAERAVRHATACGDCRRMIEATLLVDQRLRRYARAVRRAPVPDDRSALRRRVRSRPPEVWRWRAGLAGLVLGSLVVGLVVAPSAMWRPRPTSLQEAGVEARHIAALRQEEERQEAAVLAGQLQVRSQPPPPAPSRRTERPDPTSEADGTPAWPGPDGLGIGGHDRSIGHWPNEPRTS